MPLRTPHSCFISICSEAMATDNLNILSLPDEIITLVFSHLNVEDILRAAQVIAAFHVCVLTFQVCWKFHHIATGYHVQFKLDFTSLQPSNERALVFTR